MRLLTRKRLLLVVGGVVSVIAVIALRDGSLTKADVIAMMAEQSKSK